MNHLSPRLTWLLALTAGLAVATVYFIQPLLRSIGASLGVAPGDLGLLVTLTQCGYGAGLLLIVPLAERLDRRRMIIGQLLLSCAALVLGAQAGQWWLLLAAMLGVGLMAVVVQVVVAYAASLANPAQRGQVIGTVTSGIVVGILLARLLSGAVADVGGWRLAFAGFAGLMLGIALLLGKVMPEPAAVATRQTYGQLLRTMARLFLHHRLLRQRGVLAMLVFADFSILWSSMVLPLSAPPWSLNHTQVGLFGLAGIVGALGAARAGRWADAGLARRTSGWALALLAGAWLPIAWAPSSLWALLLGVLMLDFAVQAVHVTNQSLLLAEPSQGQSQLIGAYMCFYSVGSALGALAATQVYAQWGWQAVCALGAGVAVLALAWWLLQVPGLGKYSYTYFRPRRDR